MNPEPETPGIGFSFPDRRGMANCHSPNPRGMKIAWEWASLAPTALYYYVVYKTIYKYILKNKIKKGKAAVV